MDNQLTNYYNLYAAKEKFSEAVRKALQRENVMIMNRGRPIAKIMPFSQSQGPRALGFATGITMLSAFDEIPKDFQEYV
ncbi:MAG: type II toxin-antitoxin system prevent-host-death family antitoxin [Myxococcaceae bacterium]|nr:type II toxin-antitoxin system prevent-host-death family antitoxin [Myxococcaceae bacterium]MBH2005769.1 type II toxin-antitoxin system prevent-host-death family antitoxin [Myxococcaceae bacterium]